MRTEPAQQHFKVETSLTGKNRASPRRSALAPRGLLRPTRPVPVVPCRSLEGENLGTCFIIVFFGYLHHLDDAPLHHLDDATCLTDFQILKASLTFFY